MMPQKEAPIWGTIVVEIFPLHTIPIIIESNLGFLGASFCNIIDILSGFPELFMFELCQTGSYHLFENYRILN